MEKLDMILTPVPFPAEPPYCDSAGFITEERNIASMTEQQILNTHAMLHLFFNNKCGKNLTPKTIKKLHIDCVTQMTNHDKYDQLDE